MSKRAAAAMDRYADRREIVDPESGEVIAETASS
jgi:hypothetical protein